MIDYSNKELRAFVMRAARGAYMPWGLAEEAAASVAWLERHNIPAVGAVVDLLMANDGLAPADLAPDLAPGEGDRGKGARTCPVIAGAYLSDLRGTNLGDRPLEIGAVCAPVLLVPFLVWVARDLDRPLQVRWGRVRILVGGDGVEIVSGAHEVEIAMCQDVAISLASRMPELSGVIMARTGISKRNQLILDRFAHRTLLPESEDSKASGAGGDRIDDD